MRRYLLIFIMAAVGCDAAKDSSKPQPNSATVNTQTPGQDTTVPNSPAPSVRAEPTLVEAREAFETKIIKTSESYDPPETPPDPQFALTHYESSVGRLAAFITADPGDSKKHPAIIWIHGGDCNAIGDVWTPMERENDQSASSFRKAGIVMMFPALRGGHVNTGKREGFLGEVDDILAATEHLASLSYVDAEQIYLGGHSTGGTMVMLVGASTDRYRAIFSLGPVAAAGHYGGDYVYCDPESEREMELRSPIMWTHCVKSPMYVFEGADGGNWESIQMIAASNTNPQIHFSRVPGHSHFSAIAPIAEVLARQIVDGKINVTSDVIEELK